MGPTRGADGIQRIGCYGFGYDDDEDDGDVTACCQHSMFITVRAFGDLP
jgi:hypothetical protein